MQPRVALDYPRRRLRTILAEQEQHKTKTKNALGQSRNLSDFDLPSALYYLNPHPDLSQKENPQIYSLRLAATAGEREKSSDSE